MYNSIGSGLDQFRGRWELTTKASYELAELLPLRLTTQNGSHRPKTTFLLNKKKLHTLTIQTHASERKLLALR